MGDPLHQALREAIGPTPVSVSLATIDSIESHSAYGFLLNCTIRPDGRKVQARPLFAGKGISDRWSTNDPVLLLLPEGEPNRALAVGGLNDLQRPKSSTADNTHIDVLDDGGMEVRKTDGATVEKVLKGETYQGDLDGYLSAVDTLMAAITAAFATWSLTAPPTMASNGVFIGAVGAAVGSFQASPAVATLKARASTGAYASPALKSE